jgi:tellurite resistance protein TerC
MTPSIATPFFWTAFLVVVLALLAVDLGVFQRKVHSIGVKEALGWSVIWVSLSLAFGSFVHYRFGAQKGLEFFAGYLIEYALSVDNVFVFILIFSYFKVPAKLHHRVLFWGILGALAMRAGFILAGAALLQAFHWMNYVFGGFLVFTGIKILRQGETNVEPEHNPVVRWFRRVMPLSTGYQSNGFFIRRAGKTLATPLALVLVTVETTDLVFATDSIPAIFAVTSDPFIVYTSNVCAILGLRSMYFLLAAVIDRFAYLGQGLGIVLAFVGVKMLIGDIYQIPISISLGTVAVILFGSVVISLLWPPKSPAASSTTDCALIRSEADEGKQI